MMTLEEPAGKEETFRIADDQVRGDLVVAQKWACGACGADLVAGATTIVYASPPGGGPVDRIPVLVHESCADEQRVSLPDFDDAHAILGRSGDAAVAARALEAAVALHRGAINAIVAQAVGPLDTKIKSLETEKAELGKLVAKLREEKNELLLKNRQWSEAFTQQRAFGQELERRIAGLIKDTKAETYLTRIELIEAIAKHLQPEQAQA